MKNRVKLINNEKGLTIEAPTGGSWYSMIFGLVWLCGWLLSEFIITYLLLKNPQQFAGNPSILGTIIWLAIWTVGGLLILNYWIYSSFGKDNLILIEDKIEFRQTKKLYPTKWKIDKTRVRRITLNHERFDSVIYHLRIPLPRGAVLFRVGKQDFIFGSALSKQEAEYVVRVLNENLFK